MSSPIRPQTQPVIDYPVELLPPDIAAWRTGNTGTEWVHSFAAEQPGPHALLMAVIHGNEPAGAVALVRLLERGLRPVRGRLTLAFGNVAAYARFDPANPRATRWVDEDLNRVWSENVLAGNRDSTEIRRARELAPFVEQADYLLDLHTTQHPNEPLILAGPLERSRRFARAVGGADLVVIDKGHAQGGRMRDYAGFGAPEAGKTAMLIECGQHWAAQSAEVAYAAALRFLDRLGMLPNGFESGPVLPLPDHPSRFVEITMPVTIRQEFVFAQPLRGGEIIPQAGTVIGYDGSEPVATPHDDCVVIMPSQRLWAGLTAVRLGRMAPAPEPLPLPPEARE